MAEQLRLIDDPQAPSDDGITIRRNGREGGTGRRPASQRSSGSRASTRPQPVKRRAKLPSDRTIAGVMLKRIFKWIFRLIATFLLGSVALVIVYRFVDPPVTPLMFIRMLEGIGSAKAVGIDKEWIDIDDVSPALLRSLIAAEDGRFFIHNGIDWKAVDRARQRNERSKGKKLYGASTISMQCARNVFLWQGRNYIRKGLEVYFTYLIEFFWTKKRILEIYSNVIEWGDGIYGAEAAAQHYFGVSASQLNARQAALLAVVLPNPRVWDPAKPTRYINGRASTIQARAGGVGLGGLNQATVKEEPKKPRRKR
jgi:monofunctional biosynthetic peptidoglycan transglycosylase